MSERVRIKCTDCGHAWKGKHPDDRKDYGRPVCGNCGKRRGEVVSDDSEKADTGGESTSTSTSTDSPTDDVQKVVASNFGDSSGSSGGSSASESSASTSKKASGGDSGVIGLIALAVIGVAAGVSTGTIPSLETLTGDNSTGGGLELS